MYPVLCRIVAYFGPCLNFHILCGRVVLNDIFHHLRGVEGGIEDYFFVVGKAGELNVAVFVAVHVGIVYVGVYVEELAVVVAAAVYCRFFVYRNGQVEYVAERLGVPYIEIETVLVVCPLWLSASRNCRKVGVEYVLERACKLPVIEMPGNVGVEKIGTYDKISCVREVVVGNVQRADYLLVVGGGEGEVVDVRVEMCLFALFLCKVGLYDCRQRALSVVEIEVLRFYGVDACPYFGLFAVVGELYVAACVVVDGSYCGGLYCGVVGAVYLNGGILVVFVIEPVDYCKHSSVGLFSLEVAMCVDFNVGFSYILLVCNAPDIYPVTAHRGAVVLLFVGKKIAVERAARGVQLNVAFYGAVVGVCRQVQFCIAHTLEYRQVVCTVAHKLLQMFYCAALYCAVGEREFYFAFFGRFKVLYLQCAF